MLCWQAHCSLSGARGHRKRSDPPRAPRDTRKAGLCRAFTEGGSWGRVLSGQRGWPLSTGQPGALGPSGFSSTTARTRGQVYGSPGPALRPRSRSAGSPGLSQTPPCIQGTSPGASGQERLPLPSGGGHQSESWNPACCPGEQLLLAQWAGGQLAAAEDRGCSHPLHRTPSPAHTSSAQPGGEQELQPHPWAVCPSVLGQHHSCGAVQVLSSPQEPVQEEETQSSKSCSSPSPTRARRALGLSPTAPWCSGRKQE